MHAGPYLWIGAPKHYEFCHFDPDDGLLCILAGVWAHSNDPSDYQGERECDCIVSTIWMNYTQTLLAREEGPFSQMFNFLFFSGSDFAGELRQSRFQFTQLIQRCCLPGVRTRSRREFVYSRLYLASRFLLFWLSRLTLVSAIESTISVNIFWGNEGPTEYLTKVLDTRRASFMYWVLNIIEQNSCLDSFPQLLPHLRRSLSVTPHYFLFFLIDSGFSDLNFTVNQMRSNSMI